MSSDSHLWVQQDRLRDLVAALLSAPAALFLLPGRRRDRRVYRAEIAGATACFVKVFDHAEGYTREARALTSIPTGIAPAVLATVDTEKVIVTQAITGTVAAGAPLSDPLGMLVDCLVSFRLLLDSSLDDPVDPIPLPGRDDYDLYFQELADHAGVPKDALCDAVGYEQPLLPCHGDLTPNNVIVTHDGVCLIDFEFFGVSQPLHDAVSLCLSPSLNLPIIQRVAMLEQFTQAVTTAHRRRVTTPAVVGAVVTWAVRFAARLHRDGAAVDAYLAWQEPLRIAGHAIQHLQTRTT